MNSVTEAQGRAPSHSAQTAALPLTTLRQFTIQQIGARLSSEPGLVARFWDQIAKSDTSKQLDITVFFCAIGWRGQIFSLIEFVAGETLEEFVKRSDPAVCEQEIPLFCRLLDAFEGAGAKTITKTTHTGESELLDFGVVRASSSGNIQAHGAVLSGHDGTWSESIFGKSSANEIRPVLMELSSKLRGGFQHTPLTDAPALNDCGIMSLAAAIEKGDPVPSTPLPAVTPPPGLLAKYKGSPYVIAVGTTVLVLGLFYGVGGFLAKRSVPANAGGLNLPPAPSIAAEVPATPQAQPASPAPAAAAKKEPKQPNGTIVLTRGARPLVQTKLQYPPDAKKDRITGIVEMQVTIAEDGSVHSPKVLSGDPVLGAGLAEQVSKWVYQPLKVNGKAVPMTTELAVRFDLSK